MPDFDTRVGVYCAIVQDGAMLLTHLRTEHFGREFGWSLPGGGIELHETLEECAVREVREETGYDVEIGSVLHMRTFTVEPERRLKPDKRDRYLINVQIIYTATIVGGELHNEASGSTDYAEWVPIEQTLRETRVSLVDAAVEALQQQK